MIKKTRLIVSSDSWGWSWFPQIGDTQYFNSQRHNELCGGTGWHHGFPIVSVLYQAYGYDLTTVGCPGCDNFTQIHGISQCEPADAILFMQTDPLRDISNRGIPESLKDTGVGYEEQDGAIIIGVPQWSVEEFEQQVHDMLREIYTELCKVVCEKHPGCKLVAVGANSAINTELFTEIANQFGCDLHILSYCLLDTLPTSVTESPSVAFTKTQEITKPVHPCFLFRLSVDDTWNPDLINHLYEISPGELWADNELLPSIDANPISLQYKKLSAGSYSSVTQPDLGHINAGSHIWLAEAVNLYLESRGL